MCSEVLNVCLFDNDKSNVIPDFSQEKTGLAPQGRELQNFPHCRIRQKSVSLEGNLILK
jgi:hypothetical protein